MYIYIYIYIYMMLRCSITYIPKLHPTIQVPHNC